MGSLLWAWIFILFLCLCGLLLLAYFIRWRERVKKTKAAAKNHRKVSRKTKKIFAIIVGVAILAFIGTYITWLVRPVHYDKDPVYRANNVHSATETKITYGWRIIFVRSATDELSIQGYRVELLCQNTLPENSQDRAELYYGHREPLLWYRDKPGAFRQIVILKPYTESCPAQ